MSRASEPAPAAAGLLRPAPQPSRTAGRGSREDSGRAPRRVARDVTAGNQSPPGPGDAQSPAPARPLASGCAPAAAASCQGVGASGPEAPQTERLLVQRGSLVFRFLIQKV